MDFRELILTQHARTHSARVGRPDFSTQDLVLRDMTGEQMRLRPQPGFNSLAWLLWHMPRGEDIGVNVIIAERSQVLDEGGWFTRLNVSRRDLGTGMTDEEVDGFNEAINISELLAYRELVGARTQEIIRGIKPEVLDKVIDDDLVRRTRDEGAFGKNAEWVPQRWVGKNKAFTLTWTVVGHSIFSFGECYVIRSLLGLPNI